MKRSIQILSIAALFLAVFMTGAQAAEDCSAKLTIANVVELRWSGESGSVNLYGTDDLDTGERVTVAAGISGETGRYSYDLVETGMTYYDYYILENADGGETTMETEYILPRVSKELTNVNHPFLITNQSEIDRVRKLIFEDENKFYQQSFQAIKKQADARMETFRDIEHLWPRASGQNKTIVATVQQTAVMWVLTDEEKYLNFTRDMLLLLSDYLQDNDALETELKNDYWHAIPITKVYDLIYNGLNEVERQVIENGCLRTWWKHLNSASRGQLSNMGGINHVSTVMGLALHDQEMLDWGLNRPNYGVKFFLLEGVNDDGSLWNYPTMYFTNSFEQCMADALMFHNSGYDLYNAPLSGQRHTAWWSQNANYRSVEDGDTALVEDAYPLRAMLDFGFYYMYGNRYYPNQGDSTPDTYYMGEKTRMLPGLEYANKLTDDPKVDWILGDIYGKRYMPGEPRAESEIRSRGSLDAFALLYAEPEIQSVDFSIGSGYYAPKGYTKLGSSVFNDYGKVMLRSPGAAGSSLNVTLFWKNYWEQGHGHNDLFNITMFGLGKPIIYDTGSYTYGTSAQSFYATDTPAHNLMVIDEKSYQYDSYSRAPSYVHKGFRDATAIGPAARAIRTNSDRMYRDEPNQGKMSRTLWQIDDYLVDIYTGEMDGEHQYDYLLNINGELDAFSVPVTETEPTPLRDESQNAYSYIKKYAESQKTADTWNGLYSLEGGGKLKVSMLGAENTKVIAAKAARRSLEYTAEKLVVRRNAENQSTFFTVLQAEEDDAPMREVAEIPVKLKGRTIDWAQAAVITDAEANTEDTVLYGVSYGNKEAGRLTSDAETAFLRQTDGADTALGGIHMKYVSGDSLGLKFSTLTSAQFAKLSDEVYRLDIAEGNQNETAVTLYGLPEGYQVYRMELSDTVSLRPVSADGYKFTAQPEGIYLIAASYEAASAVQPETVVFSSGGVGEEAERYDFSRTLDVKEISATNIIPTNLSAGEILIEGEDFAEQSGGQVAFGNYPTDSHATDNPYGTAFYNWDVQGHSLSWNFKAAKSGKYRVKISYATQSMGVQRTFAVNDMKPFIVSFDTTETWSSRHILTLTDSESGSDYLFELQEGDNTITMENVNEALNIDYIMLELVE